ncbi:RagB/SusD family nutrient uptake outer membrane protein [Pedobacter sp.]|uniref:RagB/SusD family nutrient uptake outer membrane protein n=1 Tax=Pedobacter sp. TaxID=1411316 RepID=UPI003BAB3E3D
MKKIKKLLLVITALSAMLSLSNCDKGFLDAKPDKSLLVPESLADLRALLDNISILNLLPSLNIISADEFVLGDNFLTRLTSPIESGSYFWKDDAFQGATPQEWTNPYQQIFYSNVVLEGLDRLGNQNPTALERDVKGCAFFFRSMALFNLSQLFAAPYVSSTAKDLPGLPIPLSSDVNKRPGRGSLSALFAQIIADLSQAVSLLPERGEVKSRPGRQAAHAMLARVYLIMGDYEKALVEANRALSIGSALINYNTLSLTSNAPFGNALPNNNAELIFFGSRVSYTILNTGSLKVEPELLALYDPSDLRLKIFFRDLGNGLINLKTYDGIGTDEVLLIKAECLARANDSKASVDILNSLLVNRFPAGKFVPLVATDASSALGLVLNERRKELVARGLRWSDLRRLNGDSRFLKRIIRIYNGSEVARLEPTSNRYTFPIPDNELLLNSLEQNPR